jgi:hypothetical protein
VRHTSNNFGIIAPNYNVIPGDPWPAFDLLHPYDSDKLEPSSFPLRASG